MRLTTTIAVFASVCLAAQRCKGAGRGDAVPPRRADLPPRALAQPRLLHRRDAKWRPARLLVPRVRRAEGGNLRNGHWAVIYNDTEMGRHRLAVSISDDEGKRWKWTRHLERETPQLGSGSPEFHYPSLIQARDGTLHASYSYRIPDRAAAKDAQGRLLIKSIKRAHFNEAWVTQGTDTAPQ